eukprot:TRINITY_DN975_c0_g3_i1.p1 TRINITY_DN975_c0_g3~~TRINITY_DN975_c0_g3_i1.p1  ORF type:complete len:278 (-),score=55.91 TRINITY_DN975_c0_g3_i1:118-951(-)
MLHTQKRPQSAPSFRPFTHNTNQNPPTKSPHKESFNASPQRGIDDAIRKILSHSPTPHKKQHSNGAVHNNTNASALTSAESVKRRLSEGSSIPEKKAKTAEILDDNIFHPPKYHISHPEIAQQLMKHRPECKVGAGLENVGNTCFLNSVLQCLTHTAPLAHYAVLKEHSRACNTGDFCMFCILERHINRAFGSTQPIVPKQIAGNLRVIGKHFRLGRQEDSHEFMRYVIEALQKSCLMPFKSRKLEPRVAETTIVHNIFGGYLQSQVDGFFKTRIIK